MVKNNFQNFEKKSKKYFILNSNFIYICLNSFQKNDIIWTILDENRDYTPMDKNLNYNCFTDSNYFNRRILELTENGELAALLFLYIYGSYPTVLLNWL